VHPSEQQLWARLSVFAGSFELEAAEHIYAADVAPEELDDLLTSLVDKSIVTRTESKGVLRFRLIDTLRDYGREKIQETDDSQDLRRRHLDWYRRLASRAGADWFSPRQLEWIKRLDSELHNLREALEFALSDVPELALEMVASLHWYGGARGFLNENRRWLDRALAATPSEPTTDRIRALRAAAVIAGGQGDLPAATARAAEARMLADQTTDPVARGLATVADGFTALLGDEFDRASSCFDAALAASDDPVVQVSAMMLQGLGASVPR
jgi:serine/threonine-protein kinase PknK